MAHDDCALPNGRESTCKADRVFDRTARTPANAAWLAEPAALSRDGLAAHPPLYMTTRKLLARLPLSVAHGFAGALCQEKCGVLYVAPAFVTMWPYMCCVARR